MLTALCALWLIGYSFCHEGTKNYFSHQGTKARKTINTMLSALCAFCLSGYSFCHQGTKNYFSHQGTKARKLSILCLLLSVLCGLVAILFATKARRHKNYKYKSYCFMCLCGCLLGRQALLATVFYFRSWLLTLGSATINKTKSAVINFNRLGSTPSASVTASTS